MNTSILSVQVRTERDVVLARQRARQVAASLGFDGRDQTRVATAVSEIARNAYAYAGGGRVEMGIEGRTIPQIFVIQVSDEGPGIDDLPAILEGRYRSSTGMGMGLLGARRLMDRCDIASDAKRGTTIVLKKLLPRHVGLVGADALRRVTDDLLQLPSTDPFAEVQRQNQELMRTLEELEQRQQELIALNRELEDTNRGVVALYAELDEKADHLRRADELKSRFLSNMSHEFRTPVNSIQALSRILLERIDGDLTNEQQRQVGFISKAADSLGELVGDLLDLAKVEAGKIVVRPIEFDVEHLFGALRGMLRPLLVTESVNLVFEPVVGLPTMFTDEGKVSQILRNFVSNALKFTEQGEIRITARLTDDGDAIVFGVADTGIGIAAEDQERIFHEFTQIDSPVQRRVHGTGLGLPLCRKLADVLGGRVEVASELGVGSTFTATIPLYLSQRPPVTPEWTIDEWRNPILIIEDSPEYALLYEKMLAGTDYQPFVARTLREARHALASFRPRAIVLDILLRGEDTWALLAQLKSKAETLTVPIIVVSEVDDEAKMRALGADQVFVKPIDRVRLLEALGRLIEPNAVRRVLIVDDEEISRYVLRQHLWRPTVIASEEATGSGALARVARERPDVIFLDLGLPDIPGSDVLRALRENPATQDIPVVIVTANDVDVPSGIPWRALATDVLTKAQLSRESALGALDKALASAAGESS
jgi:signal transduction histidine kinase/CheY-like chemotaxis protein